MAEISRVLFPRHEVGALERWFSFVSGTGIVIAGLWIFADVAFRWLANSALGGAEEISALLMVMVVMLSLSSTQAVEKHLSITTFVGLLPDRPQAMCKLLALLVAATISVLLTWTTFPPAIESWNSGHSIGVFVSLPVWPSKFAVPLGATLLALRLVLQIKWQLPEIVGTSGSRRQRETPRPVGAEAVVKDLDI
ncbi:MAG: TRAP transporter small permease [Chloroflexi bacterium]|nr:TRAP transporter small permease [Chloroflexota bacterium]